MFNGGHHHKRFIENDEILMNEQKWNHFTVKCQIKTASSFRDVYIQMKFALQSILCAMYPLPVHQQHFHEHRKYIQHTHIQNTAPATIFFCFRQVNTRVLCK